MNASQRTRNNEIIRSGSEMNGKAEEDQSAATRMPRSVHASILTPEVVRGDDWRNIAISLIFPDDQNLSVEARWPDSVSYPIN
jgi:hypothetical protein